MKLLFSAAVMLSLLLLSCTKDKSPECGLNPPDWLKGIWFDDNGLVEWNITQGNLIKTSFGIGLDFCEEVTGPTNDCDCKEWIEEIKTDSRYRIRLETNIGVSFEQADFVYISENSISEDGFEFTRQ